MEECLIVPDPSIYCGSSPDAMKTIFVKASMWIGKKYQVNIKLYR